jgi:hypothetical protein
MGVTDVDGTVLTTFCMPLSSKLGLSKMLSKPYRPHLSPCIIPGFVMPATKADFVPQQPMGAAPAEGEAPETVLTLDGNMPQAGGSDQGYTQFERAAYPVTVFMSDHQGCSTAR